MAGMGNHTYKPKEPGTNRKALENALESLKRPRVDVRDPKAIERRITEYLQYCLEHDIVPGVVACANWLGINYITLVHWYEGTRGTPEHQQVAARFYGIAQDVWQQNMDNGTINNITGMFMGKAFYGFKDTQEIVVTHKAENELSAADLIAESRMLPGAENIITVDDAKIIDEVPSLPTEPLQIEEKKAPPRNRKVPEFYYTGDERLQKSIDRAERAKARNRKAKRHDPKSYAKREAEKEEKQKEEAAKMLEEQRERLRQGSLLLAEINKQKKAEREAQKAAERAQKGRRKPSSE